MTTSLGAKLESNLRNTGVAASAASKRASKGMGEMASVFDESIAKPMKDAPSALRTLADPESWNLLQSGLNPLDKPKLIGTFELTSTKQRAKLKRKAPEFEKKPSPVAPEVLLRTVRTLPSKLKYDYELRVKAREKEEAVALNRQLSDGRGVDAEKEGREEQEEKEEEDEEEDEGEQARRGQMTALSSGDAPPLWSELEAQSIGKQVPISNDAPVAAPVDFMIGSTAINPSAYEDDDDDDDEAMQVVDIGGGPVSAAQEAAPSVVVAATVLRQVAPGVETSSAATTAAAAAAVAAPASASPPPPPPPPLIVETTAQTKQILDEEAMKKIGTTAIDVVFFLAETAFKAAAPIVRDGGATAFARLQETLLPDDGMSELRKAEAKRQQQPTSSPSTALGRLNEPRGADASGGSRILGTLSRRTQQQRRP